MTKITAHQLYQSAEIARLRTELEDLREPALCWNLFESGYGKTHRAIELRKHGEWRYIDSVDELKKFLGAPQ